MTICGAKTRSGSPCKSHAVLGRTRCRMHGGAVPRGAALPQTIHGRYSKSLPTRLRERFDASERDPELLNLRQEIALIDSRTGQLLELDDPDGWPEIVSLIEQRRKLVETERKRLVEMQQMITAEQAAVLIAALTDAVRRHVDDPDALAAIASEFDRLLARDSA